MKINILTLFPEMFSGPFQHSIIKRAIFDKKIQVNFINIRDFGLGKHKVVDDKVFGGGVGMILRVDVIAKALESIKEANSPAGGKTKTILLDARGKTFSQKLAKEFSDFEILNIICGHYEGFDERILELVDETISIGDFILTGGEIAAMLITDSVARLVLGVLKDGATNNESFSISDQDHNQLLEYPQYTLPREFNGMKVPEILLNGNHKEIEKWKKEKAIEITKKQRPDLVR